MTNKDSIIKTATGTVAYLFRYDVMPDCLVI